MDLTQKELKELHLLTVHFKKAVLEIFGCQNMAYMFYEKPGGHVHFVLIPLHGLVDISDKHAVLAELIAKTPHLKADKENMRRVIDAISRLRQYFSGIEI